MNKKLKRIIMFTYILLLIVMISGATYAYFTMIEVSSVSPQIKTQAATTEWLIFSTGEPIEIMATEENFAEGMGSLTDKTYGSVLLRTNNNQFVSHNYKIFLEISDNEFVYTTADNKAELLLKVTDPDGNEITEIEGLNYVTVNAGQEKELSGFDITNALGRYYFASNYEISTDLETQDIWNVEVTFVNLDSDQNANAGKTLTGNIRLEKVV